MNIYFLVEGKKTEIKVYPQWLNFLIPMLKRVSYYDEVVENNYYIFSGNGFPSLLDNHLRSCILDINKHKKYDYFVICLDADDAMIEERKNEILQFMKNNKLNLRKKTKLEIIVQNKCFETWFLGNPKIYKPNPSNDFLKECVLHYNVKSNDPELMTKLDWYENSVSDFHTTYLREMLAERNVRYSKNNPNEVVEEYYLNELINRNNKTNHISSFKSFIDFCQTVRNKMNI
jgi:hypothetical protein